MRNLLEFPTASFSQTGQRLERSKVEFENGSRYNMVGVFMTIHLPEEILKSAGLTEKDIVIELAVHLYGERKISFPHAVRISGLGRLEFERELHRRKISLFTVEDLRSDVADLEELRRS
jgi:predicted HTH domain antitoxin